MANHEHTVSSDSNLTPHTPNQLPANSLDLDKEMLGDLGPKPSDEDAVKGAISSNYSCKPSLAN